MKNISLYLNIVLIVAVTLLYVDRFSGSDDSSSENKKESITKKNNSEVVYINIDSLMNSYDLYNERKTELMKEQGKLENSLNSKSKSLERKAMEFQQKVEKRLVTNNQAQQMQQQLMQEQQNLLKLKEQMQMQLMQKEQEMNKEIYKNLTEYLEKYNKGNKHKIILSNTYGGNVLLAEENLNITEVILVGLNEEYQNNPKEKLKNTEDKK